VSLPFPERGLYAVTADPEDFERLKRQIRAVLAGGARVVQLRDKHGRLSPDQVRELVTLCHDFRVPLIVNDRVDLVRRTGADGVHLGRDDTDIHEARKVLGPDAIIGISCYRDLERADAAERAGASYVAFGAFFSSPSKPEAAPAPLSLLRRARRTLRCPIVAIGGITPERAPAVIEAGADLVAVISALFHSPDPRKTAAGFARLFPDPEPKRK